ncbi:MAG: bifunctional demethylmenaquinone methyltransferase/2-methoxy-6-polyprenyl-1,4-benzoquinol methylase UbiE [Bacteroidia bacterium]|jgi:demethylmenaquinone methyltransferase/2-methoxy-6-polyprenyl-1,4-benzoquinol methylase|nr:bifunctional demethylmenaquinone methyltransferase/2-methoxy-6-polyprenyl-1,4-benzoquinol methylase UbiE [Bacteroidia bacterium]
MPESKPLMPPPAAAPGKKRQVEAMFDSIAHKYDFLNHFLSVNIDKLWRKKVVKTVAATNPSKVLDVATGTADLAIALSRFSYAEITGIDISRKMLDVGDQKLARKKLNNRIKLMQADSENLPFADETFDAVMVAFGVRNFEDLDRGLSEMFRVTRKGGMVAVLEFSKPNKFPVKQLYNFYFRNILPALGRIFSKDKGAYTYLPESVNVFPEGKAFMDRLSAAGYSSIEQKRLTFGIATFYSARKE